MCVKKLRRRRLKSFQEYSIRNFSSQFSMNTGLIESTTNSENKFNTLKSLKHNHTLQPLHNLCL